MMHALRYELHGLKLAYALGADVLLYLGVMLWAWRRP